MLLTDGEWYAAGYIDDNRKWHIQHFAVCQEYDWTPTHWMPLPAPPVKSP